MRILIVRVSALGDAIHTLPALDILKRALPDAKIDWVIQHKITGIVHHIPGINRVYTLNDHYLHPRYWLKTLHTLMHMRRNQYDLIIDFQGLLKTTLIPLALDAPSIGFNWRRAREPLSSIIHLQVATPAHTQSIIEKNNALARAALKLLRVTPIPDTSNAALQSAPIASKNAEQQVDDWLALQPAKNLVLLSPNTTWPSKHWPLQRWQELVRGLRLPATHQAVLVGQNFGDQGAQLATFIQEHNLPITIAPSWVLDHIFAVMRHTTLIVGPDTGLLHIADSLGVPTIGLYGPTKVVRHGPQITPANQARCLQALCPHNYQKTHGDVAKYSLEQDCMYTLKADVVLDRINSIITG